MDKDQNGTITFDEVLMAFAVSTRSSLYNRLIWIFKLYDSDRDGILSQKDVALVVKSVYDLLGPCTPPVTPEAIEEHVEWLFQKLDLNKDGVIDMNEFIDACQDDPDISCGLEPSSLFHHSSSRVELQQSESCAAESGSASSLFK